MELRVGQAPVLSLIGCHFPMLLSHWLIHPVLSLIGCHFPMLLSHWLIHPVLSLIGCHRWSEIVEVRNWTIAENEGVAMLLLGAAVV